MRFAIVSDKRVEASPGVRGRCTNCESELIAKCGTVRVKHWAHQARPYCDPWWENETEWHRTWKDQFPVEWQEISHPAENGERHIADVKTEHGWVLEFQHSHLTPEERRSRDAFYPKLVWVVDGVKRKKDKAKFIETLNAGAGVLERPRMWRVGFNDCALLRDWAGSPGPVLFDFGPAGDFTSGELWCQLSTNRSTYVVAFPRAEFVGLHRPAASPTGLDFAGVMKKLSELVSLQDHLAQARAEVLTRQAQPNGFQRHLARQARFRKRL